ncbi:MAG: hypothetical protein DRN20_05120 [Thermoplasmata archaeon]|nr:MAG: hypothetical protein DRN20_05120 [Thermoplasmata archaeon]
MLFEDYGYERRIYEAADRYPDVRSVYIEFMDIAKFSEELMNKLLDEPLITIEVGEGVVRDFLPEDLQEKVKLHVRVKNIPASWRTPIRKIRSIHLGKFVSVDGIVRKADIVRPKIVEAAFKCMRCGGIIYEPQEDYEFKKPMECYACGKSASATRFRFIPEKSKYMDVQIVEIQEKPEGLRGGEQPQFLRGIAHDDIAGLVTPGDRVVLNGIILGVRPRLRTLGTIFDMQMKINSIDIETREWEETYISPEDEKKILELAKDKDIVEKIVKSIAPTIYGMEKEKEGLALQLFGGIPKEFKDTRIRGDIHILLVGDPGTAKSQLLRYISRLAPRGIYASGKSSSAAGLTAAAIRDESTGRWTLEAGALVLADLGIACVDEIDKMSPQDRSSMHEAMEQQTVTVAKAGINTTLLSRCAILGAANPKYGRFSLEPERPLADQIDIPPALLSRFDLIFLITDRPDADKDAKISEHILNVHLYGELSEQLERGKIDEEELEKHEVREVKPPIDPELLRKYIAYAKKNVFPVMTKDAKEALKEYYVRVRNMAKSGGKEMEAIPMTVRQLEAFVRLAEASARMRLSKRVEKEDAERAIKIVEYSLRKVAMEEGVFDIDKVITGISHKRRSEIRKILDIIDMLSTIGGERPVPVSEDDIIAEAEKEGIDRGKARDILRKLRQEGEIYMPKTGYYLRVIGE